MKKISKQAKLNIVFIAFFALVLMVPLCFINLKPEQGSEIENKMLAEWPEKITLKGETTAALEDYFNDRIGFREPAIGLYTELNNKLFGVMVHPLFMWGSEGHIYYKDKDYIKAYQRMNTDPVFIDSLIDFLKETKDYLDKKEIPFVYFVCPDKKTIYPEYFPDTINVNEDNISVLDYLDEHMKDSGVPYINPREELSNAKKDLVVYNKLYDATHWNDFGAFIGHCMLSDYIGKTFDDVKMLDVNDYNLEFVNMTTLDNAKFAISDDVPLYSLKYDASLDYTELLRSDLESQCETTTFYTHHINPEAENDKILLVFTDSYFQAHQKYYDNRFKEVYFVHRQNYAYVQYFVNLVFPDMVIFETAERSISSEMPMTEDFTGYSYEMPYTGEGDWTQSTDVGYTVINTVGCHIEDSDIVLDNADSTGIVRIECTLDAANPYDYDVYALTDAETIETDYCEQMRKSEEEGVKLFSVNIQRRFMAQSSIKLVAVDRATGDEILLENFGVR